MAVNWIRAWRSGIALTAAALVFLVAAAGAAAPAAAAQPRMIIAPTEGSPGTPVTIDGSGFCGQSACSTVRVLFGGVPVATDVRVSPNGTFHAEGVVPGGSPPGDIFVVATQTDASGAEIRAEGGFTLTFPPPTTVVPQPTAAATSTSTPEGTRTPAGTEVPGSPTPTGTISPVPSSPTPGPTGTTGTPGPSATGEAGGTGAGGGGDEGVPIALWLGLATGLPLAAILAGLWLLWRRGRPRG